LLKNNQNLGRSQTGKILVLRPIKFGVFKNYLLNLVQIKVRSQKNLIIKLKINFSVLTDILRKQKAKKRVGFNAN